MFFLKTKPTYTFYMHSCCFYFHIS